MSTASALPETLKSITHTKFEELKQQRDQFETTKAKIQINEAKADGSIEAAEVLLNSIKALKNINFDDDDDEDSDSGSEGVVGRPTINLAKKLYNARQLLRQAAVDPSIPSSVPAGIQKSLKDDLELESLRHEHAQFFSTLVTEWLSTTDDEDTQSSDDASFEKLGRKEMHEQRATWESLVFKPHNIHTNKLNEYLNDIFNAEKATSLTYATIVKETKQFSKTLWDEKEVFDVETLPGVLRGLLSSDLLSPEKTATLRTFLDNKEVLSEIVDVLNMRYASLSKWNWTTAEGKGVPVEMRRQLNGKYRVFMDEDVLDAILLYEIGLRWSIHFKTTFTEFFNSVGWKKSDKSIPKKDLERRKFYLTKEALAPSLSNMTVLGARAETYSKDFFLAQLPVNRNAGKRNYDEDNEVEEKNSDAKGPLELKHSLLHLLVAESIIAKELDPDCGFTVVRSDFKWFGPSLPHDSIFAILKFFGVSETWMNFFHKFLEVPLHFVHDGKNAQAKTRSRGIPMSHTLSDVFGEVVLFVMDTAVNQAADSLLYRLHDDFWIWGSLETCLKGWQAMAKFASTVGIEFNREKTGTVLFDEDEDEDTTDESSDEKDESEAEDIRDAFSSTPTTLPEGEIRWGFLVLDEHSGRFIVDQKQVDTHIEELKTQLASRKSIFSYVQAYNAYAGRFFTNNFGKPSYGFGVEHVDMMINTFTRIQKSLFPEGSVTDHLAAVVAQRFGMKDLPNGFWYWPIKQGGLELTNPLVPLLAMRASMKQSVDRMVKKTLDKEFKEYYQQEQKFGEHGGHFGPPNTQLAREIAASGETFLPLDEYLRYREQRSLPLASLYKSLLGVPNPKPLELTSELKGLMSQGSSGIKSDGLQFWTGFGKLIPYWTWLMAMYSEEIVAKYGSVNIVDAEQIPIGVVSIMQKGKVRWSG